jgi:hypothetical protein
LDFVKARVRSDRRRVVLCRGGDAMAKKKATKKVAAKKGKKESEKKNK